MGTLYKSPGHAGNEIEEDSRRIQDILQAARNGQWNVVFAKIGTPVQPVKAYLLNAIPDNRRWGVIHQAVYWKQPSILRQLLQYNQCDVNLRTKQCTSEVGDTSGKDPKEIADAFKYTEIKNILTQATTKLCNQEVDTFLQIKSNGGVTPSGLIHVALASYKNTLHPKTIDPKRSISSVLSDVYIDMNGSTDKWKAVRDKVCDAIYVLCQDTFGTLNKSTSKQEFYEAIIGVYTQEITFLYTYLNTALRRQKVTGYTPCADDLALGPYAVTFQMLLLFWDELKRDNQTTYRRMKLYRRDLDKYTVGTQFTWLSFVSSSASAANATAFPTCGPQGDRSTVFTIDNRLACSWQPRNIEKYACYMEQERIYPAGATFLVTGRTERNTETHITIKLIDC